MLEDFRWEWHLLTNSIWAYTIEILWVNQWEVLAKQFTPDVDFGCKDMAYIQNDLLYIFVFVQILLAGRPN